MQYIAGQRIDSRNTTNGVPVVLHANGGFLIREKYFHVIAFGPEGPALEINVVSSILNIHELLQKIVARQLLPFVDKYKHLGIFFGRAQTIDRRNGSDHNGIAAR